MAALCCLANMLANAAESDPAPVSSSPILSKQQDLQAHHQPHLGSALRVSLPAVCRRGITATVNGTDLSHLAPLLHIEVVEVAFLVEGITCWSLNCLVILL